jgi:hypothetical protein
VPIVAKAHVANQVDEQLWHVAFLDEALDPRIFVLVDDFLRQRLSARLQAPMRHQTKPQSHLIRMRLSSKTIAVRRSPQSRSHLRVMSRSSRAASNHHN